MNPEQQTIQDAYAQLERIQRRRTIRQCVLSALFAVCGIILAFQPETTGWAAVVIILAGVIGVVFFGVQLLNTPASRRENA